MSVWRCSVCGSTETHRRAKGMCHECYHAQWIKARYEREPDWRAKESMRSYQKHREKVIARTTEYNRRLKWEVIERLGGKCACCGEATPEFMTVDHINGDGAAHRALLTGKSRASSIMIYKDIKRRSFPTDTFRVLCMNCNFSLGAWGYCPHQISVPTTSPRISLATSRPPTD